MVDLVVVPADVVDDLLFKLRGVGLEPVGSSTRALNLSAVKHVLEQAVVEMDGGELLELTCELLPKLVDYKGQKVFHRLKVIHKNLKEVLNLDLLVGLKLESKELVTSEGLFELSVLYKCHGNIFDHLKNSLALNSLCCDGLVLILFIVLDFEKLRDVLLETLHFFLEVVDLLVDGVEGSLRVVFIFNLNLHQQPPLLALLGQSLSDVQSLNLLATDLDSCVDVEVRLALALRLTPLNQRCYLVLVIVLHVAVQEQRSVVLVVVARRVHSHLLRLNSGRFDEQLQVLDQVG